MKITKETLKRAIRTFAQAFFGSFIATGSGVIWYDINIQEAIAATLITSIFAGLSATYMNLEKEGAKNGNCKRNNKKSRKSKRK